MSSWDEVKADLECDGYAIVKGAVPKERAAAYCEKGVSWLEGFDGLGFKRDDVSTWNADHLVSPSPSLAGSGMSERRSCSVEATS